MKKILISLIFLISFHTFLPKALFPETKQHIEQNGYFLSYAEFDCSYKITLAIYLKEDAENYYYRFYTLTIVFSSDKGVLCKKMNLKAVLNGKVKKHSSFVTNPPETVTVAKKDFEEHINIVTVNKVSYVIENKTRPVFISSNEQAIVDLKEKLLRWKKVNLSRFWKLVIMAEVLTQSLFPGILREANQVKEAEVLLVRKHPLSGTESFALELQERVAVFARDSQEETELQKVVFHKNKDFVKMTLVVYTFAVLKEGRKLTLEKVLQLKDFSGLEQVESRVSVVETEIGSKVEQNFVLLNWLHLDFLNVNLAGSSLSGFFNGSESVGLKWGEKTDIYSKNTDVLKQLMSQMDKMSDNQLGYYIKTIKDLEKEIELLKKKGLELEEQNKKEKEDLQNKLIKGNDEKKQLSDQFQKEKTRLETDYKKLNESLSASEAGKTEVENKHANLSTRLKKIQKTLQGTKATLVKTKKYEKVGNFFFLIFGGLLFGFLLIIFNFYKRARSNSAVYNLQQVKLKSWKNEE